MKSEVGIDAYRTLGTPRFGGVLVVSDHASNRVPPDIDLGIDPALLDRHFLRKHGPGAYYGQRS